MELEGRVDTYLGDRVLRVQTRSRGTGIEQEIYRDEALRDPRDMQRDTHDRHRPRKVQAEAAWNQRIRSRGVAAM